MLYSVTGDKIVQDGYEYPAVMIDVGNGCLEKVAEAYLHDDRRLPHEINGDINMLFPKAHAAEALAETAELADPLETRGLVIGKMERG